MRYMQRSPAIRNAICFSGVLAFAAIVALAMDALGASTYAKVLDALGVLGRIASVHRCRSVVGTVPTARNRLRRLCGLDPV